MRNLPSMILAAAASIAIASPLTAAQRTGAMAQDFKLTDVNGKTVQLSQFRGKTVVLEWHNPGCPFVSKHYNSGNMQMTQKAARQQGAVWLTINSGAKGKQGHMSGAEAKALIAKQNVQSSNYLFDTRGVVGKAYGAKTTPHMYIIDDAGILVYQGGIDDKPTANPADIKDARNHVLAALGEIKSGDRVSVAQSRPYGCSVKYAP